MYFNAAPPASILASKYIWILFLRVSFQNLEHAFAEILANESDFPHLELIVADVFQKPVWSHNSATVQYQIYK